MVWILAAGFVILFIVIKQLTSKRMKFWRMVSKRPDVAFAFMMDNPDTFAFDNDEEDIDRAIFSSGPFYFVYYTRLTVYANPSTFEAKQTEFVEMFK